MWLAVAALCSLLVVTRPEVAQATAVVPGVSCSTGTTLVIVAHEDDDLLFLSPDLAHDVASGRCVHTVFLTAGDDGSPASYWSTREQGPKAAYALMAGVANAWTEHDTTVPGHTLATFTLDAAPRIALTYVRLPDGFLNGLGFPSTTWTSLQQLYDGRQTTLQAVDGSNTFTSADLTASLTAIMTADQPDTIRIQDPLGAYTDGDHSDHHASAQFALAARQAYTTPNTLIAYRDYSIAGLPENVDGNDRTIKTNAFVAYAAYDPRTCQSEDACKPLSEGQWLSRQYEVAQWTPTAVEQAPVAAITAHGDVRIGARVVLDGSASTDADGNAITYSWQQTGGTTVALTGADTAKPTFTAPTVVDTLTFALVVSDGVLPSAPTTVTVRIVADGTNLALSAAVTASSQNNSTGQTAAKVRDGSAEGYPGDYSHEWASQGEGVGAWIQLAWTSPQSLTQLVLHDRPNLVEHITNATLVFSDGTSVQTGPLENDGSATIVNLPEAITTTSVKLTVTAIDDGGLNIGLSEIEAYGDGAIPVTPPPVTTTNVAPNATVTASTQDVSTGQTAAKAVDGSADGYPGDYSHEWATQGEGVGAWIQLTWTSPQTLTQLVLHDRPNLVEHITDATITFSDGTSVHTGPLENDGTATTITLPAAVTTTSVRVTVAAIDDGGQNIGLSEIEADATSSSTAPPPAPETNVASAATVSASTENASTGQTAIKVVDGSAEGYPGDYSHEWATAGETTGAWIQLDWASPQTIDKVVLHDRPNLVEHVTDATIVFSDGTTIDTGPLENDGSATTITFPAVTASAMRITVTAVDDGAQNIGLSEVETYSPGAPTTPVTPPPTGPTAPVGPNLALASTVTASTQNDDTGQTAAKVIDGSADGYPGDYSHEWATQGETTGAWIQLDWAGSQTIGRIVLHDRPNLVEHVTDATILFSDGTTIHTGPLNNDGSATTITFPAVSVTAIKITVTAVDDGAQNIGLSEIEAYAG
ncbi:MAG: hypothetical protein JWM34_4919 [Ilumatobacteraceae bacterium]|nr:hypothetical protein [Ilumatobacteraceae bacterium]